MVTVVDIEADNGVVHVINAVLVPESDPEPVTTVVDIIVNSEDHNTLEAAVIAADLVDALSGEGPFTVFAPTDEAFSALPDGTLDLLLQDPTGQLTDILTYHVHSGDMIMSDEMSDGDQILTLNGQDLTVSIQNGNVYINDAMVTIADIEADNGVVHVINAVLVPSTNTSLNENLEYSDFIIKSIDIMGNKLNQFEEYKNKIIIDIYKSGRIIKRINF